jgi:hypothetical protein
MMVEFNEGDRVFWTDGGKPPKIERGVVVATRQEYPQVSVRYAAGQTLWTPARDLSATEDNG